ncbi:Transcriptional activator protein NhaR [Pseudoalteromonas sp. CIP111854]|uniref:Transcriptional activator protein NhaR n=1 Tax=Pseudoalteromonas holothuriae TaxID=2963714 RepID=A0A9W4QRQ5_9GAMM|nr:LysR family transcriptional regulator [Pseudoalteromonas sp. CIP111854]CAH9050313.1 Transcriptional activator protein NhaR [Pseudoalteromonas sp. CIP111854]
MNRLNYHHLYYFWRVATLGNLTQVAKELHLSQSALSTQIRSLEQRYGVKLFDRVGRTLRLTDAGQRVLTYAQDIFSTGDELEQLLKFGVVSTKQSISIGVLTHLSRNFVEGLIAPLLAAQNIQLKLSSRGLVNLLDGLINHEFDFVLTNRMVGNDNNQQAWQHQLLRRQPISIVGPKGQKPTKPFPQGYEGVNWVLPAPNTEVRSAFDSICAINQYKANILAEADDMAMLRLLSRDSGACAVLPPLVVLDELKNGSLEEYQALPSSFEHFYAISLPKKQHSDAVLNLLKSNDADV